MARELITSWSDYHAAVSRLLAQARVCLRIYDEDLMALRLDAAESIEEVKRLLQEASRDSIQIALRNGEPLRTRHPRLLQLMALHSQQLAAQQTPSQLAHLRDSLLIVDDRHALVRFERDLPRSKLLIDEPDEVRPYLHRFQEIWAEGGEAISPTVLGL